MSELNNNISFDVKTIRSQSDEIKLSFIENVLRETGIPANFLPEWRTNSIRKIFFRIKDGFEEKREWVLFENGKLSCAYCLCFALQNFRFVNGVVYEKGGNISDSLNKHEKEAYHKHAIGVYSKLNAHLLNEKCESESPKRVVLRAIIKAIIFIATHGKCTALYTYFMIMSRASIHFMGSAMSVKSDHSQEVGRKRFSVFGMS